MDLRLEFDFTAVRVDLIKQRSPSKRKEMNNKATGGSRAWSKVDLQDRANAADTQEAARKFWWRGVECMWVCGCCSGTRGCSGRLFEPHAVLCLLTERCRRDASICSPPPPPPEPVGFHLRCRSILCLHSNHIPTYLYTTPQTEIFIAITQLSYLWGINFSSRIYKPWEQGDPSSCKSSVFSSCMWSGHFFIYNISSARFLYNSGKSNSQFWWLKQPSLSPAVEFCIAGVGVPQAVQYLPLSIIELLLSCYGKRNKRGAFLQQLFCADLTHPYLRGVHLQRYSKWWDLTDMLCSHLYLRSGQFGLRFTL